MVDRAEPPRALEEQLGRLQKVQEGKLAPSSTDSDVGVLSREENAAASIIRAMEEMGFGFTFAGEPVE